VGTRIFAVMFIFIVTCFAWWILGVSIFERSHSSDSRLRSSVQSTWGEEHTASPPSASYEMPGKEPGTRIITNLPVESTEAKADLDLTHRQKGLLWYSTYRVAFAGEYGFTNSDGAARDVAFRLDLPAKRATYDDLVLTLDGKPLATESGAGYVTAQANVPAGTSVRLGVRYRSQGLCKWTYKPGGERSQARNFALSVTTNFARYDVPDFALSPTTRERGDKGWKLDWHYASLVSGSNVAVAMPEHLQPGPVAGRISMFAPVSLLFFFFLLFLLTTMRGVDLHPMNYFFLAAAFFSFHLLLAYLVDWISIHLAFAICSAVSIFLVVSYLRLVVGMKFALLEAGTMQLVYLVGFSYAFFLEGMTGLAITIGAILTLFLVMQWTGRVKWGEAFAVRQKAGLPQPPAGAHS
jgi:hypothetical protein